MNGAMTLDEFLADNPIDGYYAVWKEGKIDNPKDGSFLYGFSGAVVKYSYHKGFEDYPEWMDNTEERDIKIILLSEIPTTEQLTTGDF